MSKVRKTSSCWVWNGFVNPGGYGYFHVRGKTERAHRVSWTLHRGPIVGSSWVLHKCDNRRCVNPKHLFLGTAKDNAQDRDTKGRGLLPNNSGERHGMSILNNIDIPVIKKLYASGLLQKEVASRFHVSIPTISGIVNRKTWKHIN